MSGKQADDDRGGRELYLGREAAGAVPAALAVEELGAARPEDGEQMLEVRCCGGKCAQRYGMRRAAADSKKHHADEAASKLEFPVGDISMWHSVANQVE